MNLESYKISEELIVTRASFSSLFSTYIDLKNEVRFIYVLHGNVQLKPPISHIILNTGDSLLIKNQKFINNWETYKNTSLAKIIEFRFTQNILHLIYGNKSPNFFILKKNTDFNSVVKIAPSLHLESFIKGFQFYLDTPKLMSEAILKLKTQEFLLILFSMDREDIKSMFYELFQTRKYKLQEIIQANLYEDLHIKQLASLCGVSLSSFQREFKKHFETTPAKYIKLKRLEAAKQLLQIPETRVSEVGFLVGFKTTSHFSKEFIRAFQLSPSAYQKSVLK